MRTSSRHAAAVLATMWLMSGIVAPAAVAQDKMVTFYLCLLMAPPDPVKPVADPAQLQRST